MFSLMFSVLLVSAPAADKAPIGLERLLALSLAHDGRVQAAYAGLEAYRAQYEQAWWAFFPQFRLRGIFGGPLGERRLDCPADQMDTCVKLKNPDPTGLGDYGEGISFFAGGSIDAVVPLYTFGKLSAVKDAAKAGVAAGEADLERMRQAVALDLRRAWYGWLLASAAVDVLEEGTDRVREAEKKLLKLLEENSEDVSKRDLHKLRYYAAEVNAKLLLARKGKALALAALRFLSGLAELGGAIPLAEEDLEPIAPVAKERTAYLTRARLKRPELNMIEAAKTASSAQVDLQKAAFYPNIFLAGNFEGSYSPAHDLIENSLLNHGATYYTGGALLGFELTFDVPQKIYRLEQARAEFRRVEAQARQLEEAVGLEIDQRLEELRAAIENERVLKRGQDAAKAWMRSNMMSYGVGIADTRDLLDSIAAFAKATIDRFQAIHDTWIARDQLGAAVGEDLSKAEATR